jgi:hypothetical protein
MFNSVTQMCLKRFSSQIVDNGVDCSAGDTTMSTQTFDGSYQFYVTLLKIIDYKIVITVSRVSEKTCEGASKVSEFGMLPGYALVLAPLDVGVMWGSRSWLRAAFQSASFFEAIFSHRTMPARHEVAQAVSPANRVRPSWQAKPPAPPRRSTAFSAEGSLKGRKQATIACPTAAASPLAV